jgi:hypothetical protein
VCARGSDLALLGGPSTHPLDGALTSAMESSDSLPFRLWSLFFRTLSLGVLIAGALAALLGTLTVILAIVRRSPVPGFSLGLSLLFIVGGAVLVLMGLRGFRIRTRRDLEAELAQTAADRDRLERWINR